MTKWLRWLGISVAGLVGLVAVVLVVILVLSNRKLNQTYTFTVSSLSVAPDADLENGRRLTKMHGCFGCHGDDLSGAVLVDQLLFGRIAAPNLTSGRGGIGAEILDVDWVRAIRHGVDRDAKPLVVMPSDAFAHLSGADLAEILAYIKSVPAVDNELPDRRLGPMSRWIVAVGAYPLPAEQIDHSARPPEPEPGVTVEYGEYLARFCMGCHGEDLGGREPGPGAPPGPNLTTSGPLAEWTRADFVRTIRTGVRPDGSELGEGMPWRAAAAMTDSELAALWMYLRAIRAVEREAPE